MATRIYGVLFPEMTAWGCRPEARDKRDESKLNAGRVSLVSCFAKLNKRIVPTLRLISARRHGMEGEESSWIQKKKKGPSMHDDQLVDQG